MHYIIDGYNLAFKINSIAADIKSGDTQQAVRKVVTFIRQKVKTHNNRVIVVFDGTVHHPLAQQDIGGLKLIYSKKPQTADDIIREFIRKTKGIEKWCVVSSDTEILFTAADHGAKTMKSDQFIASDKKRRNRQSISEKQNPQNVDIAYWLDMFGSGNDDE